MFYQKEMDKVLRFGDVVRGYISTNPTIREPILSSKLESYNYKIDIGMPKYSVVLTPCCSIEEGMISLTTLIKVRSDFFKNQYFAEDLTRINRIMEPQLAHSPDKWERFTLEEQQRYLAERINYALLNLFIYEENEIFKKYTLRKREIRYYMIDYKNIYTIKCAMIKRPEKVKPEDAPIIESKVLQLSIRARSELRDKFAYYYSRPPKEDMILED
ncbi:MAG: hypothetical protein ISS81_02615 [Candidatus Marinimicrobia bacterium]|nr:hypothetical protein [Candidatus Neomarinimicrobiota bacterium]